MSGLPTIRVLLNEQETDAMFDTGAAHSCVDQALVPERKATHATTASVAVQGAHLTIMGRTDVQLTTASATKPSATSLNG